MKDKKKELLVKERKYIPKIVRSWILAKTFMGVIKQLGYGYNVKSQSKRRINKSLIQLSICSRFLAKVVRKRRIRRDNRILELMTKIVRTNKHHWRFHGEYNNKKRIGEFLYRNSHRHPASFLVVVKCTIRSVVMIQRWYRWNYQKYSIFLGLMLRQWSAIEHVVAKLKASLTQK